MLASAPLAPTAALPLQPFLRLVEEARLYSRLGNRGTARRLGLYIDHLFRGVDIEGKRALDIGAGNGVFSIVLALSGAAEVWALEPQAAGSQDTMTERFERMMRLGGATNVRLERKTLREALPTLEPFDIVLLHNCINHLDERSCIVLHRDAAAQQAYLDTFRDLARVTKRNGILIIADSTRYNVFGLTGMRSPLTPSIEWEKHQPPSVWSRLARQAGFRCERVSWTVPGHLGALGYRLLSNRIASFFLLSHFVMVLRNEGGSPEPIVTN